MPDWWAIYGPQAGSGPPALFDRPAICGPKVQKLEWNLWNQAEVSKLHNIRDVDANAFFLQKLAVMPASGTWQPLTMLTIATTTITGTPSDFYASMQRSVVGGMLF